VAEANRARDRETPVAFSDVDAMAIEQKISGQDAPMLVQGIPGVYTYSPDGVANGEAKLFVRGCNQNYVQVLINGDNANTATAIFGYAQAVAHGVSAALQMTLAGGRGGAPPIAVQPRIWYNPELQSTLFLVPGLIGFIVMISSVVSTSLSIVREKERGTWEQVRMAPISTPAYVVGKTIPYFFISLVSAFLIIAASMALFNLPVRGSWLLLLFAVAVFLVGALGTGLLVSTIVDSQALAFLIGLLLSLLPTFVLSGFIFPIASMPVPIQYITYVVPARYFLVALRGIVLKGVGFGILAPQFAALGIYAFVVLALASVRLAKERG
jgi:ABC-2 type transport system permease protein